MLEYQYQAAKLPLITHMSQEWQGLVRMPSSRLALAQWQANTPALAPFSDLDELLRWCRNEKNDRGDIDRVLQALVRLAAVDHGNDLLAARVMLQLMIPAMVRLCLGLRYIAPPAVIEPTVAVTMTILIRTYPVQRRPAKIAANLALDCRQKLLREHMKPWRGETPVPDERMEEVLPVGASAEDRGMPALLVRQLMSWALRNQVITPVQAQILVDAYMWQIPAQRTAESIGMSRSTVFTRRGEAEVALRQALAEHNWSDGEF